MTNNRFKCDQCGYETNRKFNFELHKNRKTPCAVIAQKINLTQGMICNICSQIFPNRQAKYRHVKKQICCQPLFDDDLYQKKYQPFETPYVDHISRDLIKDLYLSNNRSIKKLLNETTLKIYRDFESNNSFRFPMGVKSNLVEVFSQSGKYQLLPVQNVLRTVLQKTSALCEAHLRRHYHDNTIIGITCLQHANTLKELSISDHLTNKTKNEYYPFVKAAIIECTNLFPKF